MVKLKIDNKTVEVAKGTTLREAAVSVGIDIPVLCFFDQCKATGSCMVCGVRSTKDGRMLPACAARCEEGMEIDASSDAVRDFRRGVIELLLNEHRGDCQAPCQAVCPEGLDISTMLHLIKKGRMAEASGLLHRAISGPASFCPECRGGCEKACRRGRYDRPVEIRRIIRELCENYPVNNIEHKDAVNAEQYNHRFGAVSDENMQVFLADSNSESSDGLDLESEAARCFRCDCRAADDCKLRQLATEYSASQRKFGVSHIEFKRVYYGAIGYESGKCVKCGNCVAIGEKINPGRGPALCDRGAGIHISAPFGVETDKLFEGIGEQCIKACPTGALFDKDQ